MSEINPFASPRSVEAPLPAQTVDDPWGGLWREGGVLVMHKQATLPNVCIKSNQPCEGPRLKRVLYWHHPAIFLAILLSIWIYVILALVLRKKATVHIPLSEVWWSRRRRAIAIGWSMVALGAISLVGGPIIAGSTHNDAWYSGIFVGIVLVLGGAIYGMIGARMIVAKRIDENYVWIKGVHPNYVAPLPLFPGNVRA